MSDATFVDMSLQESCKYAASIEIALLVSKADKLQAENAKLREDILAYKADELQAENDRLREENNKLRRYAAYLFNFIEPTAHQSECNKSCPAYKMCVGSTSCTFIDWAIEKACELEVEVN